MRVSGAWTRITVSIWAVIPVKSLSGAKSRMAPALSADGRATLARRLLLGTLDAAQSCPVLGGVVVVSADPEVRRLVAARGLSTYPDPPAPDSDPLNAAVALGCRRVAALGATAALVLPIDLPHVSPGVIAEFVRRAGDAAVGVAPDRAGTGTNALLLRPPLAINPAFGPDSFARHGALARERGALPTTVALPALLFDLDTPNDLLRSAPSLWEVVDGDGHG